MGETKTCVRCHEPKPRESFGPRKTTRDGLKGICRECEASYQRSQYAKSPETKRATQAAYMAKARIDPARREAILDSQRRSWDKSGRAKRKAWVESLKVDDPWRWKALVIQTRYKERFRPDDLKLIWDRQSGLCGLTARPLDFATAHLDHVIPRSRGGSNALDNVRWTTQEANQAKGGLLDGEFLALCREVIRTLAP